MAKRSISFPLVLGALLLTACAAQDPVAKPSTQDEVQAVRDFIEVGALTEVKKLRTSSGDKTEPIDEHFLIYEGRREAYLVEFGRRCRELNDNTRIVPDERRSANEINAQFDTIRGCRIHKIYALTEEEINELKNIGEAPGSRN
ncbi:MAG: DUF6491 family protein [Gammaproteobacteria bacterium]|nr:DUF6491 family protein [Gammaproteobacteria bacterium]